LTLKLQITRRIGQNAGLKLIAEIISRAATFGLLLVATRRLGQAEFGNYNFGLTVGFVIAQLADLGLQTVVSREVAFRGRDARGSVLAGATIKGILTLLVLALIALVAYTQPPAIRSSIFLLGAAMVIQTFLEYVAYVYRGQQNVLREAIYLSAARVLVAALGLALLWLGGRLTGLALATLAGILSVTSFAGWKLWKEGWLDASRSDLWQTCRFLLRQSLPLGVAVLLSITYTRAGILILQVRMDELAVAEFSAALRLIEPMQILPASLMAAVFPAYASALVRQPAQARRIGWAASLILGAAGSCMAIAIWVLAPWGVPFLLGADFFSSGPIARIMGLALPLMFTNYSLTHYLIARHQQHFLTYFNFIMLLGHTGLMWWLIPHFGAITPAYTVLVAEMVLFLGSLAVLYRTESIPSRQEATVSL
jgi:O-antigen/teichoic acid export membrane protein